MVGGVLKRGGVVNDMEAVQWLSEEEVIAMIEIAYGPYEQNPVFYFLP